MQIRPRRFAQIDTLDAIKKMSYNVSQILPLIEKYKGNIASVARSLGCTRQTIYNHIKKHPTLQQALDDARQTMLDNAESVLYNKVVTGDTTALIFFLKTQGKSRGYTERQEVTGANGEPMKIRFIDYGLGEDDSTD